MCVVFRFLIKTSYNLISTVKIYFSKEFIKAVFSKKFKSRLIQSFTKISSCLNMLPTCIICFWIIFQIKYFLTAIVRFADFVLKISVKFAEINIFTSRLKLYANFFTLKNLQCAKIVREFLISVYIVSV